MAEMTASTVSLELRTSTAGHHQRAERSQFQQDLVKGRVTRGDYAGWLGRMLWLYRALESAWGEAGGDTRFPALPATTWGRTAQLERDLADLGAEPGAVEPARSDAVEHLVRHLGSGNAAALLGVVYVLEGSTNGSVYIARAIRAALELPEGRGTAFLDPYGAAQRETWARFRIALDASGPAQELPVMIEAAQATFDAVGAMGDELRSR